MRSIICSNIPVVTHVVLLLYVVRSTHGIMDSYSYFKFSGPVSGDVQSVPVRNSYKGPSYEQTVDYVARPDYFYSYGVEDPFNGNSQSHKETRDGHSLFGEYRLIQPDGNVRIVRYTSDPKNGFQATVEYVPVGNSQEN